MLPYPLLMKFDLHKISDIVHSVETVAKQEHVYGICIIVYSTWNTSDTTQVCILTVQTAEVMWGKQEFQWQYSSSAISSLQPVTTPDKYYS